MKVDHAADCADHERVERYSVEEPSGLHARVWRCVSCGGQATQAHGPDVPPRYDPPPSDARPTGPWSLS